MDARPSLVQSSVTLVSLALASFLAVFYPIYCDDHWWHLLTGRFVAERGFVPTTDPFSFTYHGQPWVNWEWLSGLLMHGSFELGGPSGLVMLRFAALFATVVLLWRHDLPTATKSAPLARAIRLLVVGLTLLVIFGRASDRPHLYALPLLAATHLLSVRAAQRRDPRPSLVLLGLMTLWVVLHPSWLFGVLLHGTVMIDTWRSSPRSRQARGGRLNQLLYRGSPLLMLLPAALLHPPTAYAAAVRRILGTTGLVEWKSLIDYLHWTNVPLLAFLLLMAAWLVSLLLEPRRLSRALTWLSLAALIGAWLYVRFTPLFAVLVAPQLCDVATRLSTDTQVRRRTASLLTTLVGASLLLVVMHGKNVFRHRFSAEIDPRDNPVGVAHFMAKHGLAGNVLCNRLNAHAFLAWQRYPDLQVFIDGRVPQLFDEPFLLAYEEARGSPQRFVRLLDEHDIHHVVLMEMLSKPSTALSGALFARGDFDLVHFDDHGMLWTRRGILAGPTAGPRPYRYVIPPLIDESWFGHALSPDAFAAVLGELTGLLSDQPQTKVGHSLVATLAQHPAATDEQRTALERLLQGR